ncbi:hypothetical protein A0H81_00405 [Grifola frondosa]|uniref:Uncharacterized protein n=1 Tax=Grifola frondosa TaxID=5627 RepID=A0A1C7MNY4_GRIFR|nr:hypothetical protein A0H81_00405 [Grifola frondosa]
MVLLTDLPFDVLSLLPEHVDSLEDLHALVLTSRLLRDYTSKPSSHTLHRLASDIQPYPHFLLAVKARSLANWAIQSRETRRTLLIAIASGRLTVILDLALSVSPLTLADLLFLRNALTNIIYPANIALIHSSGSNLERGMICSDFIASMAHFWIYCDLFYHSIVAPVHAIAVGHEVVEPLSEGIRREWVVKFIPNGTPGIYVTYRSHETIPNTAAEDMHSLIGSSLYPVLGKYTATYHKREDATPQQIIFRDCAIHMGISTLQLYLAGTRARAEGDIRDAWPAEVAELERVAESLSAEGARKVWEVYGRKTPKGWLCVKVQVGWWALLFDIAMILFSQK